MTTPMLSLHKAQINGKPAIELVVRNATAEMRPVLDGLGIMPVPDMANRRHIICATPAELDAARNPIAHYFAHQRQEQRQEQGGIDWYWLRHDGWGWEW